LKFMAILHYAYLVFKMLGPHGVTSIGGDVRWAFDCNSESCETTIRLLASAKPPRAEASLAQVPPDPVMPKAKTSKSSIQSEDTLSKTIPLPTEEPSKLAHVRNSLDPK
jgi:hypothetical protein